MIDGSITTGSMPVDTVAPGMFSANADGQGVAAALALRVDGGGAQSIEQVIQANQAGTRYIALPVDAKADAGQVYLILFGTGIRGRSELSKVKVTAGGIDLPVVYAGEQGQFPGVDQVNVGPVPASLAGRGEVQVVVTVDGRTANSVTVAFR